jgi:hypothetical protein
MKRINEGELFQHLGDFLKAKGIELKEGSYTNRIQQGCTLLGEAINLSQSGLAKAKTKAEKKLDELRQVIHEKTAPNPPATAASPAPAPPPPTVSEPAPTSKTKPRKAMPRRTAKKKRAR